MATAPGFALRAGDEYRLALFGLAVGVAAAPVPLQRAATGLPARRMRFWSPS